MGNIIYLDGGIPLSFNSEDIPKLEENAFLMHIVQIATAFEQADIDGVRVEWYKAEDDRYYCAVQARNDSLAKYLLESFIEEAAKHKRLPTVGNALAIAKLLQKEYEVR